MLISFSSISLQIIMHIKSTVCSHIENGSTKARIVVSFECTGIICNRCLISLCRLSILPLPGFNHRDDDSLARSHSRRGPYAVYPRSIDRVVCDTRARWSAVTRTSVCLVFNLVKLTCIMF